MGIDSRSISNEIFFKGRATQGSEKHRGHDVGARGLQTCSQNGVRGICEAIETNENEEEIIVAQENDDNRLWRYQNLTSCTKMVC